MKVEMYLTDIHTWAEDTRRRNARAPALQQDVDFIFLLHKSQSNLVN